MKQYLYLWKLRIKLLFWQPLIVMATPIPVLAAFVNRKAIKSFGIIASGWVSDK